jgi:hypothetical protein
MTDLTWRKSSYSGSDAGTTDCVEVAEQGVRRLIRDSKTPEQGRLTVTATAFGAFSALIRRNDGSVK